MPFSHCFHGNSLCNFHCGTYEYQRILIQFVGWQAGWNGFYFMVCVLTDVGLNYGGTLVCIWPITWWIITSPQQTFPSIPCHRHALSWNIMIIPEPSSCVLCGQRQTAHVTVLCSNSAHQLAPVIPAGISKLCTFEQSFYLSVVFAHPASTVTAAISALHRRAASNSKPGFIGFFNQTQTFQLVQQEDKI